MIASATAGIELLRAVVVGAKHISGELASFFETSFFFLTGPFFFRTLWLSD